MRYHLAHLNTILKSVGDTVKKNDPLATIGKSGTQYAHCHFEIQKKFRTWTAYTQGLSRSQVLEHYQDPRPLRNVVFPEFDHYGWDWLSDIKDGQLHPGIDLNGKGSGDSDFGKLLYSPVYGKIIYIGRNEGGWGNHIFIEELVDEMIPEEKVRGNVFRFTNYRPDDIFFHIPDAPTGDKYIENWGRNIQEVNIPLPVKEIIKEIEKIVEIKIPVEVIREVEKIVYKELTEKEKGNIALDYIKKMLQKILESFRDIFKKKG